MRQTNRHTFTGYKHGVPGERLSYICRHCGHKETLLLIKEQDFTKLKDLYHNYRLELNALQSERYYLQSDLGKQRLKKKGETLMKELEMFLKELRRV